MQFDMTTGSPQKLIIKFIIPIILGNIFQQFYNMADTVIVGRFLGNGALAAVGSTGTIMCLLLGCFQGFTYGFGLVCAQRFGAGDMEELKHAVGNAITLIIGITIVGTALSLTLMPKLLELMNTPSDIYNDAYGYIMIISGGLFAIVIYNLSASFLRAIGNSRIPLYFLILSAMLNIILDIVFIAYFNLGVWGAALATVISQAVSGFLCIIYIVLKVPILHIKPHHLKLDFYISKSQLSIGFPMAMQYSICALGIIVVQSTLNMLGTTAIAAYNAANKLETVVTQPFPAMGVTLANYCAQNKGVNNFERIRDGVKKGFWISTTYAVISAIAVNIIVPFVIPLFTTSNLSEMISYSQTFIFLDSLFFIPLGAIFVFRESLQGAGYSFMPMTAGIVELLSRFSMAVIAMNLLSFKWVCLANGITWLITGIFIAVVYYSIMKRYKRAIF